MTLKTVGIVAHRPSKDLIDSEPKRRDMIFLEMRSRKRAIRSPSIERIIGSSSRNEKAGRQDVLAPGLGLNGGWKGFAIDVAAQQLLATSH